jgi:NitT/TauT family transport system substrate-binding protein
LKAIGAFGLSTAGAAILNACQSEPALTSPHKEVLETTTLRLAQNPTTICGAPLLLAEEFFKAEGFTDIQYVKIDSGVVVEALGSGETDFAMQFSGPFITWVDDQKPVIMLAGVHIGCFYLFGTEKVRTIADLKGKSIAIIAYGGEHVFLSSMAAYVGLDPKKDINWVTRPQADGKQLFIDGKVDAFLAFPPAAQELHARKIGQVVVNSMVDKPWSQYYCCIVAGNRAFVKKNPIATKRVVRSILKATDLCALQPGRAARFLVDNGYTQNYDCALQAMQEIPYNRWRDYDPEDTLRFYSLRLHEGGLIKSGPNDIIAQGSDWQFLNEIKKETPKLAMARPDYCVVNQPDTTNDFPGKKTV